MKYIKKYENSDVKYINILIDTSGSMLKRYINAAIYLTDFGEYDKINYIQFTDQIEKYQVIYDTKEITQKNLKGGFGGDVNVAIDFLVSKNLENYKTFIISDFYFDRTPDYSKLKDYELVKIDDEIFSFDERDYLIPKEIRGEERQNIKRYNL